MHLVGQRFTRRPTIPVIFKYDGETRLRDGQR